MLPIVKKVPLQKESFPRTWQTVIFRNYGLVSSEKIAKTIGIALVCIIAAMAIIPLAFKDRIKEIVISEAEKYID